MSHAQPSVSPRAIPCMYNNHLHHSPPVIAGGTVASHVYTPPKHMLSAGVTLLPGEGSQLSIIPVSASCHTPVLGESSLQSPGIGPLQTAVPAQHPLPVTPGGCGDSVSLSRLLPGMPDPVVGLVDPYIELNNPMNSVKKPGVIIGGDETLELLPGPWESEPVGAIKQMLAEDHALVVEPPRDDTMNMSEVSAILPVLEE